MKRYARLVQKYPHLITQDTVKTVDTVRVEIERVTKDSVFHVDSFFVNLHDTITITKDRLKVEIIKVKDSIFVNGKCDTVYIDKIIEKSVPVKYYEVPVKDEFGKYKTIGMIALGLIFLFLFLIVVIKLLQVLK